MAFVCVYIEFSKRVARQIEHRIARRCYVFRCKTCMFCTCILHVFSENIYFPCIRHVFHMYSPCIFWKHVIDMYFICIPHVFPMYFMYISCIWCMSIPYCEINVLNTIWLYGIVSTSDPSGQRLCLTRIFSLFHQVF